MGCGHSPEAHFAGGDDCAASSAALGCAPPDKAAAWHVLGASLQLLLGRHLRLPLLAPQHPWGGQDRPAEGQHSADLSDFHLKHAIFHHVFVRCHGGGTIQAQGQRTRYLSLECVKAWRERHAMRSAGAVPCINWLPVSVTVGG